MKMIHKPVSSSNLESVGYDAKTKILEIKFLNSGLYEYYKVPQAIYTGLMSASSHGTYFHQNIRNVYEYKKIG